MLARRTQHHQSVLVAHITNGDPNYRNTLHSFTSYFAIHGFSPADAALHAQAKLGQLVQLQASFQGSLDCFTALGWIVLIGAPLALLIRKFDLGKPSAGH
jgi:DHA2 family multidrug resistance protein